MLSKVITSKYIHNQRKSTNKTRLKADAKTFFYKLSHTFNGPGHKVRRGFSLLDAVALHDLSLLSEAEEPGAARLLLPVHSGRVDHIVVFENRLLELTLWREHLLQKD